ncbi:MAG: amidohydrolase, partial [Candidatus Heimdallarchaeota archaeon]|nr:amidohydrolase [Candidatus Heimdallarchaeota archaeon]
NIRGWPVKYKLSTEELVKFLESMNIKAFTTLNYAHKKGIARSLNDWTFDFCTAPDRKGITIPVGTIHPDDQNKSQEMDRIFEELGFAGIKLQLMVTDFFIGDKRMVPVYEKILEYDRVLIVHIGTGPTYSNYNPGKEIKCPYVGVRHLERFMDKYPNMKVIVPHLGAAEYEEMWALTDQFPNLYFDTAMIGVKNNPAFDDGLSDINYEVLYEKLSDRILFGSDFPNIPYEYEKGISGWLQRDMEDSFYEKLFFQNAEKLFSDFI